MAFDLINELSWKFVGKPYDLNSVLTPDQVWEKLDLSPEEVRVGLNAVVSKLNSIENGDSGADNLGMTPIAETGSANRVQPIIEALIARLKATEDSVSGADLIGATVINGLSGSTVQALLEELKGYTDTHKSSTDHDSRYYTEAESDAKFETIADLTTNRKLSATGNFTGTWNGVEMAASEPGLSSIVTAQLADSRQRMINIMYPPAPLLGAVGGLPDESEAIQNIINYVESLGGGLIFIPPNITFNAKALILPKYVILVGIPGKSILRLANGANTDLIKTKNFDTLTGQNKWFVSEGVPVGFGLINIILDGNKANNTAGSGFKVYGKRYIMRNVFIIDCKEYGWYSECGYKSGQASWEDLPESSIVDVYVRNCGMDNILYRGGHDARLDRIYSALSAGYGIKFETLDNVYGGKVDLGFTHVYANDRGIYIDSSIDATYVLTEHNTKEGIILNDINCQIGYLKLYGNWDQYSEASLAPQSCNHVQVNSGATYPKIGQCKINTEYGGTAVKIEGIGTVISDLTVNGSSTNGRGLVVNANKCMINGNIIGFNQTGGIGIDFAETVVVSDCFINLILTDCKTGFRKTITGCNRNQIRLGQYTSSGQTPVTGQTPEANEDYNFFVTGSTIGKTKNNVNASVSLYTTNVQSITIPHGLLYTPSLSKVKPSLYFTGVQEDISIDFIFAFSADATNVVIKFKLATASATNVNGNIAIQVSA